MTNKNIVSKLLSKKALLGGFMASLVLIGVCAYGLTAKADHMTYDERFSANLKGGNEVPPVDTNTNGYISLGTKGEEVFYKLDVNNGKNINHAHLHCGATGQNGPVVAHLFSSDGEDVDGTLAEGSIVASEIIPNLQQCSPGIDSIPHLIQAFREGKIYVNVHSIEHPDGVVRGQIERGMLTPDAPLDNGDEDGESEEGDEEGDEDDNATSTDPSTPSDEVTSLTGAADLRVGLNTLLQEHVASSLDVLRDIYDGAPSKTGSLQSQDINAQELASAIAGIFGESAGDSFLEIFRDHIVASNSYAQGIKDGSEINKEVALAELDAQLMELAAFFSGAIPAIPEEALLRALREHEDLINDSIEAYSMGNYAEAYEIERDALKQISGGADLIAEQIVQQLPGKF